MVDVPLTISSDFSIDFCDPLLLTQPMDSSQDLQTAVLISLATDRVAPETHFGLENFDRRGCWQDVYTGELGSWLWFGTDINLWAPNSPKLPQIVAWVNQALAWLLPEGLVQTTPTVDAEFLTADSVQISIGLVAADGTKRAITYVMPTT